MLRYCFAVLMFSWLSFTATGQFTESITSDRPGQSIGTNTVGKYVLQGQHGIGYNAVRFKDSSFERNDYSLGNTFRFGLSENLELTSFFNYDKGYPVSNGIRSENSSQLTQILLGARYKFTDDNGKVPSFAVESKLVLRDDNERGNSKIEGLYTSLSAQKKVTAKGSVGINLNINYLHAGFDKFDFAYVLVYGHAFTPKLSAFSNVYGNFNDFTLSIDAGLSYIIARDLQVSVFGGRNGIISSQQLGTRKIRSDMFVNAGLSWRLYSKKRYDSSRKQNTQ